MVSDKDLVFIELTERRTERPISVQVSLIETMEFCPAHMEWFGVGDIDDEEFEVPDHTAITLRSGSVIYVDEKPEEILRKIKEAQT